MTGDAPLLQPRTHSDHNGRGLHHNHLASSQGFCHRAFERLYKRLDTHSFDTDQAPEVMLIRLGPRSFLLSYLFPWLSLEVSLPHHAQSRTTLRACGQGRPAATTDAASATSASLHVKVPLYCVSDLLKRRPDTHSSDTDTSLPSGLIFGGFDTKG